MRQPGATGRGTPRYSETCVFGAAIAQVCGVPPTCGTRLRASERLDERGMLEWQIVDGIESGRLLSERADSLPNPAIEVEQVLADGTGVKVVWSHIVRADLAKLVTVHFFDE